MYSRTAVLCHVYAGRPRGRANKRRVALPMGVEPFAGAGVQKVEELKLNIDTVSNTVVQVVRMRIKFMAERRPR